MEREEIDKFFCKKPSEIAGYADFQDMKKDIEIILNALPNNDNKTFLCKILARHYNDDTKIDGIGEDRRKITKYFEKKASEYEK